MDPRERGNVPKKVLWGLASTALILLLAGCAPDATQSTLEPVGDTAVKERNLFIPVFWTAVAVFVIVEGAMVYILVRYRHRKGRDRMPVQTHGNTRLEVGWTIAPALVLAVVMVPTVSLIWDLARPPSDGALNITVKGYQWWWGFQYTDSDMKVGAGQQRPIEIADVMVVPTGREIFLTLEAEGGGAKTTEGVPDFQVIHSFWVPELFGKQDVMPGRTNTIMFQVDQPGTYTGQCAEFCGLQHSLMKLRVVALEPADWDAWVINQKQGPDSTTDTLAQEGEELFLNPLSGGRGACIACHAVGDAGAAAAPNLSHFNDPTHECFGGCNWETSDVAALKAWLDNPAAMKDGAKMPDYQLSSDEIDALVAYLYSLT